MTKVSIPCSKKVFREGNYAVPWLINTVKKEVQAPNKRPTVREKIMMVPARLDSFGSTAVAPMIIQRVARNPFEAAIKTMKMIGNASLSKTTGSLEFETSESRKRGKKITRARVAIQMLELPRYKVYHSPEARPNQSKRLKTTNIKGTKRSLEKRLAPS